MKRIILAVLTLFLLIALIPSMAQCKDGGSVLYDAILYDVYDVHSLYGDPDGKMKFVEGFIIEILGIQVFNNTNPHIDNFGESPDSGN